jgi:hypothetical protein
MNLPSNRGQLLKLAAIPILGLILLWVLQSPDKPPAAELAAGLQPSASRKRGASPVAASSGPSVPRPQLEQLIATNPFLAISAAPAAPIQKPTQVGETLITPEDRMKTRTLASDKADSLVVYAILATVKGPVALTAAGPLRVGDVIDEDMVITDISSQGIFIKPK